MLALIQQYRLLLAGLALLAVFAAGWCVNGWRLAGDLATARTELSDYKLAVSERDRRGTMAALQETQRRITALDEEERNATEQLEAARGDAARAGTALERLELRYQALERRNIDAGNAITAQLGQAADAAARMRAELLSGMGKMAGLYADEADQRRINGLTCQRSYDAVKEGG